MTLPAEDPHLNLGQAIKEQQAAEQAEKIRAKIAEAKAKLAEAEKKGKP